VKIIHQFTYSSTKPTYSSIRESLGGGGGGGVWIFLRITDNGQRQRGKKSDELMDEKSNHLTEVAAVHRRSSKFPHTFIPGVFFVGEFFQFWR
jgi:hypothetical protein